MGAKPTFFTLKAKLAVLFLVLALVPLGLIGTYAIRTTERIIVDLVLRQLENAAVDRAGLLERWLSERRADMQVIAGTSLVASLDPQKMAAYLNRIQEKYGVYKALSVTDAEGTLVYTTHSTPTGPGTAPGDFVGPAPQTLHMSGIAYLPEEAESTFQIVAPIQHDGDVIGAVYGTVGTRKIIDSILNISLGATGECYLVDKDGTFLVHKQPHRILKENISQSETFKNIFALSDRKQTYLDYRGVAVLGRFQQVVGTDWFLVVEQDRDEAFASVNTLRRYLFGTVLLCISSAFLLTWIIARHVVRPIRTLARSADRLAEAGDKPALPPTDTDRRDEIGILCRAFENMAVKVRQRQDSLEQEVTLKEAELKETDITLRQIKLIAERSEKFAAIGRLGAALAHEIRTPLTSIKLFLESVQAEIGISAEYEEDFTVAMGQIKRIEAAVNRLLDFTKPQDLVVVPIAVDRLVAEVVFMVRPMANKQDCALEIHAAEALPPIVGDKRFLEEALVNLLINSLEAMPEEGAGCITINAALDHSVAEGHRGPRVRIDVTDNGQGIRDEHMPLLFEPFFTTKTSGTGLGLPLVHHTVKRHGGHIAVAHRKEGPGTVFSIYLPAGAHGAARRGA